MPLTSATGSECERREDDSHRDDSHRETMPSLGATRANHVASSARLHANEKTVGAFAAHDGRLIGAFHGDGSLFAKNLKLNTKMGHLVNRNGFLGQRRARTGSVDNFALAPLFAVK